MHFKLNPQNILNFSFLILKEISDHMVLDT